MIVPPAREATSDGGEDSPRRRRLAAAVDDWAAGRSWLLRAPVLFLLIWILRGHLGSRLYQSVFRGIDLAFHEIGHVLFSPFGQTLGVAGGTVFQLAVPLIAAYLFYRQADYFAIAVCIAWLGINLFETATYIGDARARSLPLVSPFGGVPAHDFEVLLARFRLLHRDLIIAMWTRRLAVAGMLTGTVGGAWVLWRMARAGTGRQG